MNDPVRPVGPRPVPATTPSLPARPSSPQRSEPPRSEAPGSPTPEPLTEADIQSLWLQLHEQEERGNLPAWIAGLPPEYLRALTAQLHEHERVLRASAAQQEELGVALSGLLSAFGGGSLDMGLPGRGAGDQSQEPPGRDATAHPPAARDDEGGHSTGI